MTASRVIPPPVERRLILSLLGWRFSSGVWVHDGQVLTEEAVDRMSAPTWEAFIRRGMTAASAVN